MYAPVQWDNIKNIYYMVYNIYNNNLYLIKGSVLAKKLSNTIIKFWKFWLKIIHLLVFGLTKMFTHIYV